MTTKLTDEQIAELERLEREAWVAPWTARTFEIDCPCPNGEHCGCTHTCEEVESPEAYPASAEQPASPGEGQCVVQIAVPGLESLAGPTAAFIAAARNALPSLLAEVRASRSSSGSGEGSYEWAYSESVDILQAALDGLPEAEADLPMPRMARRAAEAITRLRSSGEREALERIAAWPLAFLTTEALHAAALEMRETALRALSSGSPSPATDGSKEE